MLLLALAGEGIEQLHGAVEMVLDDGLAPAGDEDELLDARRRRLLHGVLDERPVDDRQHLLRQHLGGRQHPGAEAGHREHHLAQLTHPSPIPMVLAAMGAAQLVRRSTRTCNRRARQMSPPGVPVRAPAALGDPLSLAQQEVARPVDLARQIAAAAVIGVQARHQPAMRRLDLLGRGAALEPQDLEGRPLVHDTTFGRRRPARRGRASPAGGGRDRSRGAGPKAGRHCGRWRAGSGGSRGPDHRAPGRPGVHVARCLRAPRSHGRAASPRGRS